MAPRELPLLSRRQIEGMIAEGRAVFILDQQVVKADAWMPYHPGGDTAIRHMIGRDATDEVTVWVAHLSIPVITRCACADPCLPLPTACTLLRLANA